MTTEPTIDRARLRELAEKAYGPTQWPAIDRAHLSDSLDPEHVLALLDALDRAEAQVAALREALTDVYIALVSEHSHDGDAYAPWPSCLPVHIALNRARAVLFAPVQRETA